MHFQLKRLSLLSFLAVVEAQQIGTQTREVHPNLAIQKCTKTGGCVTQQSKIVLDANWRWLHSKTSSNNCYTGSSWDSTLCPNPVACAQNCALDGADYTGTYGITASGSNLTLLLYPSGAVGSRVYLLTDDTHYTIFKLKNQEFTFDVDVSGLPCGTNGALYFTNMAADGGVSQYPNNKAGAAYGTGYCDAQCPQDPKFINGEANLLEWNPGPNTGRYGSCCAEMDVWEANSISTAYTAHPCSSQGQTRCDSHTKDCGNSGLCDKDGCDFNPYRMGNTSFYGFGETVKTNTPNRIRVITQFVTTDNTATGALKEIRRIYIQGGQVIQNSVSKIAGVSGNLLSDTYCSNQKTAFGDPNRFQTIGGMNGMGQALNLGMVLTMSVWVDYGQHMLWLDSTFPSNANPASAGAKRGSCGTGTGNPPDVRASYPNAQVKFMNIKYGDIGTTYGPPYP